MNCQSNVLKMPVSRKAFEEFLLSTGVRLGYLTKENKYLWLGAMTLPEAATKIAVQLMIHHETHELVRMFLFQVDQQGYFLFAE